MSIINQTKSKPSFLDHSPILNTKRRTTVAYARKQKKQIGGGGFGRPNTSDLQDQNQDTIPSSTPPLSASPDNVDTPQQYIAQVSSNAADNDSPSLPAFSRNNVISACILSSAIIAVAGIGIHELAPFISVAAKDGHQDDLLYLLSWNHYRVPSLEDTIRALAAAGAITLGRMALISTVPSFKQATDASNTQVLTPLTGPLDILVITLIPAIAEELLFRGALIPAIYPDWRGAVIAGAVFGALHANGGRNAVFAAWAGVVGCVYGGIFLLTGNVVVPIVAHGLGNVASAVMWLSQSKTSDTVS